VRKEIKSYAKINLHLAIGPKRDDGFHDIQSIFAKIDLHDLLIIDVVESEKLKVVVNGLHNCELEGEDTITKAIRLWCEKTRFNLCVRVNVIKNIPIKAGLGGGSSNAAYVLKTINNMYCEKSLNKKDLLDLALKVGSDVPFFIYDTTFAYVEGQGEKITPIDINFDYQIKLFKPIVGISTKGAFNKLDNIEKNTFKSKKDLIDIFKSGLETWKVYFYNDFELVVESEILNDLNNYNDIFSHLSGSGSTCFIIYNKNNCCYNNFTFLEKNRNNNYYNSCFFSNI